MERTFVQENARELKRMRAIINGLTDEELNLHLYAGWTISVALAHLAFWDQRSLVLIRKWRNSGISPSPIEIDVVNDSLVPLFLALPPRISAKMAVSCAEAIDSELEELPEAFILELTALKDTHRLNRHIHRKMHLDEIEATLASKRNAGIKQSGSQI
jgi:hypothetical protein